MIMLIQSHCLTETLVGVFAALSSIETLKDEKSVEKQTKPLVFVQCFFASVSDL